MNKSFSENRRLMQNPYAYLNDRNRFDVASRNLDSQDNISCALSGRTMREGLLVGVDKKIRSSWSYHEIEQVARNIQNKMWLHKRQIYPNNPPTNPIKILDPIKGLELIGYQYELSESLGQFYRNGQVIEVAGIVDSDSKQVRISRQFSRDIQNFTAAHELGHALLHDAQGLHRDRPFDGSTSSSLRESIEVEADKFATYFLMPEKVVRKAFKQMYRTDLFYLSEETMFAFASSSTVARAEKCKTLRDLSRILASIECYNGLNVISLACQFGVSTEAMAIRLEELGLLEISDY